MLCGIEFEYMLVDVVGPELGRIRDFGNLEFAEITRILTSHGGKLGLDDPRLAKGDLGIRSGYWYLEGDERFDERGQFRTLVVKGVEIRTPPEQSVNAAVAKLLELESALSARLLEHGLGLAISAYHPLRDGYVHDPPLNPWELRLRREEPSYGGSLVSTVTYGPDINLSLPDATPEQCLDLARKLNFYAPYLVAFSLASPFAVGRAWGGLSKRTWERAGQRPAVKCYLDAAARGRLPSSTLVHEARSAYEHGRIEFKPFDAMPSAELLTACAHLLVGVCLDDQLHERSEDSDVALYRCAALQAFDDATVLSGAREVLRCATAALAAHGDASALDSLACLDSQLQGRCTPAHALLAAAAQGGPQYSFGGLARTAQAGRIRSDSPALAHSS
jgi:hypothetical protein